MPVKLNSSGGGSVTIAVPSTASAYTLTAPAMSATLNIQGPAFYYEQTGTATSATNNTSTKVIYNYKVFDTANAMNTTTGRFQPTVAGYYYTTASIGWGPTSTSYYMECQLWKNGAQTVSMRTYTPYGLSTYPFAGGNFLVYLNGTTDYIEIYFTQGSGSTQSIQNGTPSDRTWWQGCLIRAE